MPKQPFERHIKTLMDTKEFPIHRQKAAIALGEMGDARAIPFLLEALADASALLRQHAAAALGKLDAAEATPQLLLALAKEGNETVQRHIIEALGRVGTRDAIPALKAMSRARSLLTRAEAQKSLRELLRRYPDALAPGVEPEEHEPTFIDDWETEQTPSDLTPRPPSLRGKGEKNSPRLSGEGLGERLIASASSKPGRTPSNSPLLRGRTPSNSPLLATPTPPLTPPCKGGEPARGRTPTAIESPLLSKEGLGEVRGNRYLSGIVLMLAMALVGATGYLLVFGAGKTDDGAGQALQQLSSDYMRHGDVFLAAGNVDAAIAYYERALAFGGETLAGDADFQAKLAAAYLRQQQYALAAKAYARVVALRPQNAAAFDALGVSYAKQGEYQLAQMAYEQALKIQPDLASAYDHLASLYALNPSTKSLAQAEALAQKAIQLAPAEARYHHTLGVIFFKQGRFQKSVEALERTIRLDGALVDAHYYLALVAYRLDHKERAVRELRTVFRLNPTFSFPPSSPPDPTLVDLVRRMPIGLGVR